MIVTFTLNGKEVGVEAEPTRRLVDILRETFGFLSIHTGCSDGSCGVCSVLFQDRVCPACLIPLFRLDAASVVTIEGFVDTPDFVDIEKGFLRAGLSPCRYCASSKVLVTESLLRVYPTPTIEEISDEIDAYWCSCSSQVAFLRAVRFAAEFRRRRLGGRKA